MSSPKSRKDTIFKRRPKDEEENFHVLADGSHIQGKVISEDESEAIEDLALVESRRAIVFDMKRNLILESVRQDLANDRPVDITKEMSTYGVLKEVYAMIAEAEQALRMRQLLGDDEDELFPSF